MDPISFGYQHQAYSCFAEAVECLRPNLFSCLHEEAATSQEESSSFLAQYMLGIIPPSLGGDVRDWQKGDESETVVHNMVSTSIVHGSQMPINLSLLAMLLPCSTYDRRRFAAITIRIDNPRCTALLFTSGKLVITGVKSWQETSFPGPMHFKVPVVELFLVQIVHLFYLLDAQRIICLPFFLAQV